MPAVVLLLDHLKVYGAVPPVVVVVIVPFEPAKQDAAVGLPAMVSSSGWLMLMDFVSVQPFASVIVNE